MPIIKKIWRDNTMPPTNYIWMKTDLKKKLIGIYEWYNGKWHEIELDDRGQEQSDFSNLFDLTKIYINGTN